MMIILRAFVLLASLLTAGSVAAQEAALDASKHPLPPGAKMRLGTGRLRHHQVHCLCFTPDGKKLITGSMSKLRIWDVATGKLLLHLENEEAGWGANGVAVSPRGDLLATNGRSNILYLLDPGTGKVVKQLVGEGGLAVNYVAFSPDGRSVATSSGCVHMMVLDIATGNIAKTKLGAGSRSVVYTPDGKYLTGAQSHLWDIESGEKKLWPGAGEQLPMAVAFSRDGKTAATAWVDTRDPVEPIYSLRVSDYADNHQKRWSKDLSASVKAVALTDDGKVLAAGGDEELSLWDAAKGALLHKFTESAHAVAFSPDGKLLASIGRDHCVRLRDVATGKELFPSEGHRSEVHAMAYSPDGKLLATASEEGGLILWDPATGKLVQDLTPSEIKNRALSGLLDGKLRRNLCFSPDGKYLAVGPIEGKVRLWDLKASSWSEPRIEGTPGSFTRDGRILFTVKDGVQAWELATGQKKYDCFQGRFHAAALALSPDGKALAGAGNGLVFWDVATGHILREMEKPPVWTSGPFSGFNAVAFAPDGKTVIVGSRDRTVHVFEAETGKLVRQLKGHRHWTFGACISPDGRTVAAGGWDGRVLAWESLSGQVRLEVGRYHEHGASLCAAFAPDGKTIATGQQDGTILVWDLASTETPHRLTEREREDAWSDLGSSEGPKSLHAVQHLVRDPGCLDFLRGKVGERKLPTRERMEQLIRELDGDDFATREKASEELGKLGSLVKPLLEKELATTKSAEAKRRIEELLEALKASDGVPREPRLLQWLRTLEVLEHLGNADALKLVQQLADAGDGIIADDAKATLGRLKRRK